MSDIERKARELRELIDQYWSLAYAEGKESRNHDTEDGDAQRVSMEIDRAIRSIASFTPPEGYVLVPVEPTEAQWGGLARDVVMWMECYQTRSADSLLKHLNRCGTDIPKWLMEEVKGGSHSLAKGTVAAIIYKAMLEDCPEVK